MKRDDDYIRDLLSEVEATEDYRIIASEMFNPPHDEAKKRYHCLLLCDQGYMTAVSTSGFRMTAQGHDYLDAIRDGDIWQETKDAVAKAGGSATLEILKALAVGFLKKKIKDSTGIDV